MPTEAYNHSAPEESRYITVRRPKGSINQEDETIWYFNATLQLLHCNVIFRKLILNIDCNTIMTCLDKKQQ